MEMSRLFASISDQTRLTLVYYRRVPIVHTNCRDQRWFKWQTVPLWRYSRLCCCQLNTNWRLQCIPLIMMKDELIQCPVIYFSLDECVMKQTLRCYNGRKWEIGPRQTSSPQTFTLAFKLRFGLIPHRPRTWGRNTVFWSDGFLSNTH